MKALVLAQGNAKRWAKPDGTLRLGAPKHLVVIDGETLIARTVRMLRERGVDDIVIVAPDEPGYHQPGARLVTLDDPRPTGQNLDKLFGTRHLWSTDGRTTLVLGDVWFTDDAIDRIVTFDGPDPHWFRRPGGSRITGKRWDETFAFSFLPEHHDRILDAAEHVTKLAAAGTIRAAFMRAHYARMLGLDDSKIMSIEAIRATPHQTHIDDWTDDIDQWEEWCGWTGRYYAGKLDIVVAVPWTGGDRHRTRAWQWVRDHFTRMGVEVVEGDDDTRGPAVNRSRARNNAVRKALELDPQVVFIADADTFVEPHQLWAAAYLATLTDKLVFAYEKFVRCSAGATARLYRGRLRNRLPAGSSQSDHASCAMAITPRLWETVGGYDERFTSWGGEDRAFWLACVLLGGETERISGAAYHLWHPPSPERDANHPGRAKMIELGMRYKRAAGYRRRAGVLPAIDDDIQPNIDALRAILTEPGGPLARAEAVT